MICWLIFTSMFFVTHAESPVLPNRPCVDVAQNCAAHLGDCNSSGMLAGMKQVCAKSCGFCIDFLALHKDFMIKFNKTYENEAEAEKRLAIFTEKVKMINEHNKLYDAGKVTSRLGINQFTDMTIEEVHTGLDPSMVGEELR